MIVGTAGHIDHGKSTRVPALTGRVFQVVRDLYYSAAAIDARAAPARALHDASAAGITAAAFRDATALGRQRAIRILALFDRVGLLRRVRDAHLWRPDADLFRGLVAAPPGRLRG